MSHSFSQISYVLHDGTTGCCDMVAHQYDELCLTTWDLLGPCCSIFNGSKQTIDVHQVVRSHRVAWATILVRCSLDIDQLVFPSFRAVASAVRRGGSLQACASTRDQWTCDTKALIAFFCHCIRDCRKSAFVEHSTALFAAWLCRVVDMTAVDAAVAAAIEEHKPNCDAGEADGVCKHMACLIKVVFVEVVGTLHEKMAKLVLGLADRIFACEAAAATLGAILQVVSHHVHEHVPAVAGSANPLKVDVPRSRGGRRRHYEQAFKADLASGLVKRRRALVGSEAAKVQGVDGRRLREWQSREDIESLVCLRRTLASSSSGSWCICEDAARLGKPALEVKTFAALRSAAGEGAWMMNQASPSRESVD